MRRRRPAQLAVQLALPFDAAPAPAEDLWVAVDSLEKRAERAHLERRKVVKRKLRQASLLDAD